MADAPISKVMVWLGRNVCRPLDAAELLEMAAAEIHALYEQKKLPASPLQPFLVDAVVVDLHNGQIDLYLKANE